MTEPPDRPVRVRVRVRTHRRRQRAGRRRLLVAFGIAAAGVAVWLTISGLQARSELNAARTDLARAKTALGKGDTVAAHRAVVDAADKTKAARKHTNDVVWRGVAAVPLIGDAAATIRGLAREADTLARATLPTALLADKALDPAQSRPRPDRINLQLLVDARRPLAEAAVSADAVRRAVQSLPSVGYAPPIAHARRQLLHEIEDLSNLMQRANTAAKLAPPMLGNDGVRRYFLIFQTNAEARGTGGLPGAFAEIRADHGRITMEHVGSDLELIRLPRVSVDLGKEFDSTYGAFGPKQIWVNSNVSPHFPDVAKIWMAYYRHLRPGQQVDGAIATDPVALSHVMSALGPVVLPGGERVTAANVVKLLEVDTYARFKNDRQRKTFQVGVARAIIRELLTRASNARGLMTAFGQASDEGRVLVASTHQEEQRELESTDVGGSVARHTGPSASLVVVNNAGNKLDYYLLRSLTYTAAKCSGQKRKSTISIELTNTAPRSGLPPIVTGRLDLPPKTKYVVGTSHSNLFLYATGDAVFNGGTVDSEPLLLAQERVYGHQLFTTTIDIEPGQTRRLEINLTEPTVAGLPWAPVQPLIDPMKVRVDVPTCR